MSRVKRSKTEPQEMTRRFSLPISWSLVPKHPLFEVEEAPRNSSFSIQLPRIKRVSLTQTQKDILNQRILRMKKLGYDPIGCSRSMKLQKVLLRKKINRPKAMFHSQIPQERPTAMKLK